VTLLLLPVSTNMMIIGREKECLPVGLTAKRPVGTRTRPILVTVPMWMVIKQANRVVVNRAN
jgi:hypothetical protein